MNTRFPILVTTAAIAVAVLACGGGSKNSTPTQPTPAPTLTAPKLDSPAANSQLDTLKPTLTVQNVTSDQPTGTRTYEFQISDTQSFTAATTQKVTGFNATVGKTGIAEGANGKTSFTVEADLQPTTMFYWRARAVQGTATGPWSDTFQFKSKLVGYCRAGELYDPLIFGDKLDCATFFGQPTFVPGKGLRLPNGTSYVIYTLPATITAGEFSVDIEGFVPGYTGDKGKVFAMGNGKGEFTTNDYRYDIQYRGSHGDPVGGIVFRAVLGDAVDTSVRYESNEERHNPAFVAEGLRMNPAFTYYWKTTWGSEIRLVVKDGSMSASGINGREIYNVAKTVKKGVYGPAPHLAYLGAPPNSNGAESATIPGLTYRNVYIGSRPRPDTLGSALR